MAGQVIDTTRSKTTMGLDSPILSREGTIEKAPRVAVYPGDVAGADVIVDIGFDRKVAPHDGGGYTFQRVTAMALTRDEAFNFIRALQRSLGIDPDRLVRAMDAVEGEDTPDDLDTEALFLAFDDLYAAVAEVTGTKTAAQRAGTDWASLKGESAS